MGKGYNNYMCKKFFHPTSFDNIKRKWMAEQKDEHRKKAEDEKLAQYKREQDTINSRILMGDKKAALGISFIYDRPPGLDKNEGPETEDNVKFEWQRKFSAPRESYAKGNEEILDQPFGVEVRNVRCVKCHQWGHMNTDRVCPLYGRSVTMEPPNPTTSLKMNEDSIGKKDLRRHMESEGLAFTKRAHSTGFNAILMDARDRLEHLDGRKDKKIQRKEEDLETQFLRGLSDKQRRKLLKKLESKAKAEKHSSKSDKHRHSDSKSDRHSSRRKHR